MIMNHSCYYRYGLHIIVLVSRDVCNINAMNLYIKWNRTHGNQDVIYTLLTLTTGSARFGAFGGFGAFGAFGGFFRFISGFGASFTTAE